MGIKKGDRTMDNINPKHYKTGKFECIEVMMETQGIDVVKGFCIGNAFKYLYRHTNKNQDEDIKKAKWYLDKYLEITQDNKNKWVEDAMQEILKLKEEKANAR